MNTPRLIIFDCDGVLIDSEAIASSVVADALTAAGWPMPPAEARTRFMGMTLSDMQPILARQLGHDPGPAWRALLTRSIVRAMQAEATLVDGALACLDTADRFGIAWRIASNSSPEELAAKFARTGLIGRVAGRVHSARDVSHGKPAPDLFQAAAAAQRVAPADCLVIEDSIPGCTAAYAAGMACIGYAPHDDGTALRTLGATVIHTLHALPTLLASTLLTPTLLTPTLLTPTLLTPTLLTQTMKVLA